MGGIRKTVAFVGQYRQDIAVVAVGLAVFLGLMGVFALVMFPAGQRLGDLGTDDRIDRPRQAREGRSLSYSTADGGPKETVARLTRAVRNVDHRGGSDVVWSRATDAMDLANRDAVQTQSRSRAFISFNEGGQLRLDEKSLVVIRETAADPFAGLARPTVVMVRGTLSGTLQGDDAAGLDVQTPSGLLSLGRAGIESDRLQFSLGVDEEQATRVSLVDGAAEITVDGQRVAIGAEEALTIDAAGNVVRHRMPATPRAVDPPNDAKFTFGGTAPAIGFRWQGEKADSYRLLVARDPNFDNVLVDQRTGRAQHRLTALRPGAYWWRISGIVDGHEGPASAPRKLALIRDARPPTLDIDPVPERVAGDAVTIVGVTAPGARVFVRGEPVPAEPDGRFEHVLNLSAGTNIVVVEAVDGLGNVAFASATVTSKPLNPSE